MLLQQEVPRGRATKARNALARKVAIRRERQRRDAKFTENAEDQLGSNTGARMSAFVRE